MAVDMDKLRKALEGDPEGKLMVKRGWLGEVHRLLRQAELDHAELTRLRKIVRNHDHAPSDDDLMAGVMGKGGTFDRFFGKGGYNGHHG